MKTRGVLALLALLAACTAPLVTAGNAKLGSRLINTITPDLQQSMKFLTIAFQRSLDGKFNYGELGPYNDALAEKNKCADTIGEDVKKTHANFYTKVTNAQSSRSPGPNSWLIEFAIGVYRIAVDPEIVKEWPAVEDVLINSYQACGAEFEKSLRRRLPEDKYPIFWKIWAESKT